MNLVEQLLAARMVPPAAQRARDESDEKRRKVLEWMYRSGRNVTLSEVAQAMGVSKPTAHVWMTDLWKANRVARWSVRCTHYYAITRAELERRKRGTS